MLGHFSHVVRACFVDQIWQRRATSVHKTHNIRDILLGEAEFSYDLMARYMSVY